MIKIYCRIFTLIVLFCTNLTLAQEIRLWNKVDKSEVLRLQSEKSSTVEKFQSFHLKFPDFRRRLKEAPEESAKIISSKFKMQFPDKTGKLISFWVKEAPVMDKDLAKKFPDNKSYIGYGVEDSSLKIRFSVNILGLYAMIISKDRQVQYINPLTTNRNYYKVFDRKTMMMEENDFQCFAKNLQSVQKTALLESLNFPNDLKLRTYRLAVAATGEYSQFQLDLFNVDPGASDDEKKTVVLAAQTVAMTRINAIFENDMAITMQMVSNNKDIIYLDPDTDPYTNDDIFAMLDENQTTCTNVIGNVNYDIGHVFGTTGGGVAWRGDVCVSNGKAGGATGLSNPTGDNFYFDFVIHEMGHQFGASHTFNGDAGNCNGNRNDPTAYESGSGSTLMAYSGNCAPQNVQEFSDMYFHAASISEMFTNITLGGSNCAVETSLTNNLNFPTANAGNDFTIPKSTAYKLVGQGSDADGDPITFCWEQLDNEINSVPPSDTDAVGTMYRSLNPSSENTRYLPELSTVNNGSISSEWEVTPSVGREMNFNLSVRDNNAEAGQMAMDEMIVTVSDVAGPFAVTSQNTTDVVWIPNTGETITWDVAGTDGNGINTSTVDILLSTDGGKTFTTALAANTANDGSQNITVPNISSPNCKIMIESVGNLFYALNDISFSIGEFTTDCTTYISDDVPKDIPDNDPSGVISMINVTEDNFVADVNIYVQITHTYIGDITLILESPLGTQVELVSGACGNGDDMDAIFDDEGTKMACQSSPPAISGLVKPLQPLSIFATENPLGTWKLRVSDYEPQDTGTLDSWSIELCTSQPLGIDFEDLANFKLYPNPTYNEINVSFVKIEDEVKLTIYDLLGREIARQNYNDPSQFFNESLDLSHFANGIYVLQIVNGSHFTSKKIQIR